MRPLPRPFLVICLAACLSPAGAQAATPTGVAIGADSRPTFNWALEANDESPAVMVSNSPTVDADGTLSRLVDFHSLGEGSTSWTADDPLLAGTYYWQIRTYDADWNRRVAAPQAFVVAPKTTRPAVSFRCIGRKRLSLRSGWMSNVTDLKYSLKIMQGRRTLANYNHTEYMYPSKVNTTIRQDHDWKPMFRSRFAKKETFRAVVKLTGPGVKFSRTVVARCR